MPHGARLCPTVTKTAAAPRKAATKERGGKERKTEEFALRKAHECSILWQQAPRRRSAIVHCGPVRALMTMHELIAARFPIEPHAQAAQHDHANHAQNRRDRILRAICHKHHVQKRTSKRSYRIKVAGFKNTRHLAQRHIAQRAAANCREQEKALLAPATANKPTESASATNTP